MSSKANDQIRNKNCYETKRARYNQSLCDSNNKLVKIESRNVVVDDVVSVGWRKSCGSGGLKIVLEFGRFVGFAFHLVTPSRFGRNQPGLGVRAHNKTLMATIYFLLKFSIKIFYLS